MPPPSYKYNIPFQFVQLSVTLLGIFTTRASSHSALLRSPVWQLLYIGSLFINTQIGLVITLLSLLNLRNSFLSSELSRMIALSQLFAIAPSTAFTNVA